ncbi:unnamed protein product [Cylindrotheca closterium]|uniref:Uncharacterized protein n=1 Tax=Cylindrotheca closterium TaxID=2856 RepID=A0AAD2G857_9STRA|nr:unnamed protein product [Cylindrotheca closterium]
MVIIETAVVGAAGYGAYRGGEESAKKAKQAKKEFKFGQKLRGHKNALSTKTKTRSERIAQINQMRSARNNTDNSTTTTATTATTASASASAGSGIGASDNNSNNNNNNNAWPLSGSSNNSERSNNDAAVKDRQKAVMEKLSQNKPKPKTSMFGMFKKK